MINLIGISGQIGSGKDTAANIIRKLTPDYEWKICKFAGKLKEIASLLTGIPAHKFEDQEFKKTNLGPEWSTIKMDGISYTTVRSFLQQLGTDALRDGLHKNVWVNALYADIDKQLNKPIEIGTNLLDKRFKHGGKHTRIWTVYNNIKSRCNYKQHPRYENYGGRGITLCEEWNNSFENFREWAYKNGYDENLTIDRIDNNKGYEPDNCRWVSYSIQNINQNLRKDNTSGFKGVSLDRGKWTVRIQYKGKSQYLGQYDTPEEASEIYEQAFLQRKEESKKDISKKIGFLITDCRFQNEYDSIRERGGKIIFIQRGEFSTEDAHPSEIEMLDFKDRCDYQIDNSGSLQDLEKQIRSILKIEGII